MKAANQGKDADGIAKESRWSGKKSLRREIIIVLLIKLALIMGIKMVFFSHPLSKQETQNRLEDMLAGSAQTAQSPTSTVSHSNSTE